MIECPWCTSRVEINNEICPVCKHEVLLDQNGDLVFENTTIDENNETLLYSEGSIEEIIHDRFKCPKCSGRECEMNEVAMTGAGLSKLFDIQYNHYLFVSCQHCGSVEVINPNILERNNRGSLSTILDIFFG